MDKIGKMKKSYSQETRNAALVSALDSQNSILIKLALELDPDVTVGGEKLLNYAISNSDLQLLRKLLCISEITANEKIMNEAVRLAVASESVLWFSILEQLLEKGGSKDVAIAAVIEFKRYPLDSCRWLIERNGAKAFFATMHIERHQNVAEELFKLGYGQSIQFSTMGLEAFCQNVCKNNRKGVVKRLIQDRPDLVEKLTEVAVIGGYTRTIRLLHQEKAITTIDDELLDKAIRKKRYFAVKYIVENGLHEINLRDIISAALFGSVKTLLLFVEKDTENQKLQGNEISDLRYEKVIKLAKTFKKNDSVKALLEAGYKCDTDT